VDAQRVLRERLGGQFRSVDLASKRSDVSVLYFHHLYHCREGRAAAVKQQGPGVLVLGRVVMVQDGTHKLDVIDDDLCAAAIANRNAAHECGHQGEIAPEYVMHHQHLAAVETQPPLGIYQHILQSLVPTISLVANRTATTARCNQPIGRKAITAIGRAGADCW
jgi:hypothetical protein